MTPLTYLAVLAMMCGCTAATAREAKDFPSSAIRPMVSTSQADRAEGSSEMPRTAPTVTTQQTGAIAPLPPQACPQARRAGGEPSLGPLSLCRAARVSPQESNIPQLRAFRQPSAQRFAP
jgi:hypothetical protein